MYNVSTKYVHELDLAFKRPFWKGFDYLPHPSSRVEPEINVPLSAVGTRIVGRSNFKKHCFSRLLKVQNLKEKKIDTILLFFLLNFNMYPMSIMN